MTDCRPVWEVAKQALSATDYQRVENAVRLGGKAAAEVLQRNIDQDERMRGEKEQMQALVKILRNTLPPDLEAWQRELACRA